MIIPFEQIPPDTLNALLESFITREGTDYGSEELPLEEKLTRLRNQIEQGLVFISFEESSESFSLISREELNRTDTNL